MVLLAIIVALSGSLLAGVLSEAKHASWTPGLALDLAGGREIILEAKTTDGSTIDASDLREAVSIIRKRVDASGTSEAEISTRGDKNIIVALPGNPDEETLALVREAAQLQFRPVLVMGFAQPSVVTNPTPEPSPEPSATATPEPSAAPSATATPEPSASAAPGSSEPRTLSNFLVPNASSPQPSASAPASEEPVASATATPEPTASAAPVEEPTNPSDLAWVTAEVYAQYEALDCTLEENRKGGDTGDANAAFVACDSDGVYKFILGPVEIDGKDISSATAGPEYSAAGTVIPGRFQINLEFKNGGKQFGEVTTRLSQLEDPRNKFAILLDGLVISPPSVDEPILGGKARISGDYTLASANALANKLKFGALPLQFDVQSEQAISATKGADELRNGMIAGLIGLALVVVYTLFQYRALAAVTVGSLLVAGGLTYLTIAVLSWTMGYRLSLAGVTGLIVAIGITADSFIVYFERVKDELREGRSLVAAVEHGWKRARRTILASDAVSFLAAVVLYMLAVGGVRGFAFTLGLTTLIDLAVVMLFTHPVLVLLARTKFFGEGHHFSGLDPRQLGRDAIYKGRGRVADAPAAARQTLAERKAAARVGSEEK